MEINNHKPADLTRTNRDGIEVAREKIEKSRNSRDQNRRVENERVQEARRDTGNADRLELSSGARILSGTVGHAESESEREARIAELKASFADGTLNSPERVDRAAAKLLGS